MRWIARALMFSSVLASAQQQPAVGRGVNFYSTEKEAALGAALAQDLRQRTAPLEDAAVSDYVARIGGRIAAQLPGTAISWSFTVVTDALGGETREPVAFPGGYVFVPKDLILDAADEAEFAGMLAHAMAHVAERHATRMATRGQIANQASVALIYMDGWQRDGRDNLVPMGFLPFQRAFELQADKLAVRTTALAGFNPTALERYISRMQPEEDAGQLQFSAMPARSVRLTALEQVLRETPPGAYSPGDEFRSIQDEVRKTAPVQSRQLPSLRSPTPAH